MRQEGFSYINRAYVRLIALNTMEHFEAYKLSSYSLHYWMVKCIVKTNFPYMDDARFQKISILDKDLIRLVTLLFSIYSNKYIFLHLLCTETSKRFYIRMWINKLSNWYLFLRMLICNSRDKHKMKGSSTKKKSKVSDM